MNDLKAIFKTSLQSTILFIGLAVLNPLFALEFECTSGGDNRFIRQELPGLTHLCEVTVTKANNQREVKWYANHDSAFCSEKTIELKTKYENEWGFKCEQWPDHDGVDQLSARHRTILDAELKKLIEQGSTEATPYVVEGLKTAASPISENSATDNKTNMLVIQFFLHRPQTGATEDVTHVIRDNGVSWNTMSRIDSLASHIEPNEGYVIDSALLSSVKDNGAMEVITVINSENATGSDKGCYGNQTLVAQNNGDLIARTPHRFVCAEASNESDSG